MDFFSAEYFTALLTVENALALLTLTVLEIVLGIDNLVVIAILSGKLPKAQQGKARKIGLFLAMFMRIALLLSIAWIMGLTKTLFTIAGFAFTGRDLVLLLGGAFLIYKATHEIHASVEGQDHVEEAREGPKHPAFGAIITQIVLLDIVFSLDSVITAVGMAKSITVMIIAIVIAVGSMQLFAGSLAHFIERHPTIKMLALSFLLLIGFTLVLEGLHHHVEKGYLYFAMGFSFLVEILNMRARRPKKKKAEVVP